MNWKTNLTRGADRQMDNWMGGRMDGFMDRWMNGLADRETQK